DQPLPDVVDGVLLLAGVEVAADDRVGDLPVVGDEGAQQAAALLLVDVVPGEADGLALLLGERVVQALDGGLGGGRGGTGRGVAQTGRVPAAAAAVTPTVLRKSRRPSLGSAASQSGQACGFGSMGKPPL